MAFHNIIRLERVDSTSDRLKELARQGAAEGTVVMAREQTAGRGTVGRSFFSPAGEGLYLSVLLRPGATVEELLTLTGWAAVAVREAILRACGAPCAIKWLNDLCLNGRKVCGILAELSPTLDFVVLGVGINVTQSGETFALQGLETVATSLEQEGYSVGMETLAACVLEELEAMARDFPHRRADYLARYRAHCGTVGRNIRFGPEGQKREGVAVEIDDRFGLTARCGAMHYAVTAGTVELMEG